MRNSFDIQADILEAAIDSSLKTNLVYKANLNFNIIKRHLRVLIEKNFLKEEDNRYTTTDRGFQYLRNYRQLVSM